MALLASTVPLAGASPATDREALHRDGPPPAHTGGFGEPTCRQCHFDVELNAPGGELAVGGVPPRYRAGRSYELVVTLRRPGMLRGGFQLAARFADGAAAGTQAGALTPSDERSALVRDSVTAVRYVQHTQAGTAVAGGEARWNFRWTAPGAARVAVVLHVAANAANDDDSPLGDYIYTRAVAVRPAYR